MVRMLFILSVLLFTTEASDAQLEFIIENALKKGAGHLKREKYKEAKKEFDKTIALDKNNAVARYYLTRLYLEAEALRDTSKAIVTYNRAKELGLKFEGEIKKIVALEEVEEKEEDRPKSAEMAAFGQEEKIEEERENAQPVDDIERAEQETIAALPAEPPQVGVAPPVAGPESLSPIPAITKHSEGIQLLPVETIPDILAKTELEIEGEVELFAQELAEVDTATLIPPDSRLGKVLEKRRLGQALTAGEKHTLHTFEEGSKMAMLKIRRSLLDEARDFSRQVVLVAPSSWMGHYLMARVHLAEDDRIRAKNEWKKVEERQFRPSRDFPDLGSLIGMDPLDQFKRHLGFARQQMKELRWVEADDELLKIQDIPNDELPDTRMMDRMFAELDFRLGECAYHLKDYSTAIEQMATGIDDGYLPPNLRSNPRKLIELAETSLTEEELNWQTVRDTVDVEPIQVGQGRSYGSVRLAFGSYDYMPVKARTQLAAGSVENMRQLEGQKHHYQVRSGQAYNMSFDLRRQLRKAALHGFFALLLTGSLLLF